MEGEKESVLLSTEEEQLGGGGGINIKKKERGKDLFREMLTPT